MHWRNKTMEVGPGHGVIYSFYLNYMTMLFVN